MSRSTNDIAALATKVRAALRIERQSLRDTSLSKPYPARAIGAIDKMLTDFSDEQLCRVFDVITAAPELDLEAYEAERHSHN